MLNQKAKGKKRRPDPQADYKISGRFYAPLFYTQVTMSFERNKVVKGPFYAFLERSGFSKDLIEDYDEYFDFFLERVGDTPIMDLNPGEVYKTAFEAVEDLEGDEVIEAYLKLMEYFIEYWADKYEEMYDDEDEDVEEDEKE